MKDPRILFLVNIAISAYIGAVSYYLF